MIQQLERKGAYQPPPTSFTPAKVNGVVNLLPAGEIAAAMRDGNPLLPPGVENAIAAGEINRLRALPPLHSRFYDLPMAVLLEKGIVPVGSSASELGPSLMAHWAILGETLQPSRIMGIDNQPHIVAAAQVALRIFREAGLIPQKGYEVRDGNHLSELPRADLAYMSLVSQYEAGSRGTLDWLMDKGIVGVNGDVAHGVTPIPAEDLKKGQLRIGLKGRLDTGLVWKLEGSPIKTELGDQYEAILFKDGDVYNNNRGVTHFPVEEDTYSGKVTVFQRGDQSYMYGWAYEPTGADDREISEMAGMLGTLIDIYSQLEKATNGANVWDANAALGIPSYAYELGYQTAVMMTTSRNENLSGAIVPAILMRHGREAGLLVAQGRLSQVGEGKRFQTLEELYQVVGKWVSPAGQIDSKFNLVPPIVITTITTADKEAFARLTYGI